MNRTELAWLGVESNQFGTDEFMKWCEVVGTQPYLALNMGTGKQPYLLKLRINNANNEIGTLEEGELSLDQLAKYDC